MSDTQEIMEKYELIEGNVEKSKEWLTDKVNKKDNMLLGSS